MKFTRGIEHLVYFYICDYSLIYYKRYTEFSSYYHFCQAYKNIIDDNRMEPNNTLIVIKIANKLRKIFGFNDKDAIGYIFNYFSHSAWLNYEEIVLRTRELYGDCMEID